MLNLGAMTYALGYHFGHEIFGVKNEGAVIYSATEEHRTGISASLKRQFSDHLAIQVGAAQESYVVGNNLTPTDARFNSVYISGSIYF